MTRSNKREYAALGLILFASALILAGILGVM